MPLNKIVPTNQNIYINSSAGRIFDFNTPSSRVYLGEAVNSLLKVFGDNCVISGFRILNAGYNPATDVIEVEISSGDAIIDSTFIKYPSNTTLSIDVSAFDDSGVIVPNIFFNFISTQQKNASSISLTYVNEDGKTNDNHWFSEYPHIVLAIFDFDKVAKTVRKRPIYLLNREVITVESKDYTVYPFDNISKRMFLYINESFN